MFSFVNFGYSEPPSIDDVNKTIERMLGLPNNKETYNKAIKEIKQSMKPKAEYCDLCGKQFNQQWDSVTGDYFSTNKYPFIDKFICGSCAYWAHEWFMKRKSNKNKTVLEQEEVEIPLNKNNAANSDKKEVDKTSVSCDNCLYKARGVKLKCNTCENHSNFKETYD